MSITVHISGGLGNQLFQYATGRALSLRNNTDLRLDISSYADPGNLRSYMLSNYNVKANTLARKNWLYQKIADSIRLIFGLSVDGKIYGEHSNTFDTTILNLNDSIYLLGHWQSEKYFAEYCDQIKKDLILQTPLSESSLKIMPQIRKKPSVAVHVRRGDYVSNSVAQQVLGTLSPVYYQNAVTYLEKKVKHPKFFAFSDDPSWASQNILVKHPNTTYLQTSRTPYEDLELMRACDHFIIANSSFSWWSAWLGSQHGSIVIAPKKWFASKKYSAKDLIPKHWIQI